MIQETHYDFVIAGAGIAGICAALAAARHGCRTALVCDRAVVGGNASSETGVSIMGASHYGTNPACYVKEGGIVEELRLRLLWQGQGGVYAKGVLQDAVLLDTLLEEPNITLYLSTSVYGCELEGRTIRTIFARHLVSGEEIRLSAPIFLDATGNAILAEAAGCQCRMGREAAGTYGESLAPQTADQCTMGSSVLFETEDVGHPVAFRRPAFAYDISKMDFIQGFRRPENFREFSVSGFHWTYEYGGQCDTVRDYSAIDLELRRLTYGIWDYIKNSGCFPEAANYILKHVHTQSSLRESRRVIGEYTLTQNDIEANQQFEDSIGVGGWPIDVHAPLGLYDPGPAASNVPVNGIYDIPYRCLVARDAENLLLAGRIISASHIALGSTRILATCGVTGQAAGTAAALCCSHHLSLRELGQKSFSLLREALLLDDQTIIGQHCDSCRTELFSVSASSTALFENTEKSGEMPLDRDYCLALMLGEGTLPSITLSLNNPGPDTFLKIRILIGSSKTTFRPEKIAGERQFSIAANARGWNNFPVEAPVGEDGKVYLVLCANPALRIAIGPNRPTGAVTFRMYREDCCEGMDHRSYPLPVQTGYIGYDCRFDAKRNILFQGIQRNLYAPEFTTGGMSRPYCIPNLWRPSEKLPQELILTAQKAVQADTLLLIWDSFLDNDRLSALPPALIRSYDVTLYEDTGKETTYRIRENHLRRQALSFPLCKIKRIQIRLLQSWGETPGLYGWYLLSLSGNH